MFTCETDCTMVLPLHWALSAAAKKFKVPSSENLREIAEHCNERKWAGRRAEEAGQKLYMWALIKNKEVTGASPFAAFEQVFLWSLFWNSAIYLSFQTVVCNARVLGLGPRFMSVYVPKLAVWFFCQPSYRRNTCFIFLTSHLCDFMMQMEQRIYYDEVEGLSVEWLEVTER
jgi:DIS3-like exonuclease 2